MKRPDDMRPISMKAGDSEMRRKMSALQSKSGDKEKNGKPYTCSICGWKYVHIKIPLWLFIKHVFHSLDNELLTTNKVCQFKRNSY